MAADDWLDLLLRLLEAPRIVYTRSTLRHHAAAGQRLVDSGILVHADFQSVIQNERGEAVEVDYDNDHGHLGYYDRYRGWVPVEQSELERFKPDLSSTFAILLGEHLRPLPNGPKELDVDCWAIGSAKLIGHRSSEIWFARTLWQAAASERLRRMTDRHPSETLRLVLTSTPDDRIANRNLAPVRIVPIADVVSPYQPDKIDFEILRTRFQGHDGPRVDAVVHFAAETGVLTVHGKLIVRVKTDRHRRILQMLVETHDEDGMVDRERVLRKANSEARSFDQAFGKRHWPALNSVFQYDKRDRVWRFIV